VRTIYALLFPGDVKELGCIPMDKPAEVKVFWNKRLKHAVWGKADQCVQIGDFKKLVALADIFPCD
jgi:hypothetical protein